VQPDGSVGESVYTIFPTAGRYMNFFGADEENSKNTVWLSFKPSRSYEVHELIVTITDQNGNTIDFPGYETRIEFLLRYNNNRTY